MAVIEKRVSKTGCIAYRAKVRLKGFQPQTATFNRKTDADRWAQRIEADMRDGRYFPNSKSRKYTVADLLDAYLADLKIRNAKRHDDVKTLIDWWIAEFGFFYLSDFTSEHVLEAQHRLKKRTTKRRDEAGQPITLGNATVNRYTIALGTAFNFGVRRLKWIKHNPVADVTKFQEPPGRIRFLSGDEIERLIAACKESKNKYLLSVVIMGISTGARRGEIEAMRWADVNTDRTRITLPKTKNGQVRAAHVSGLAFDLLKRLDTEKSADARLLFPSPNDPDRPIDFRHAWEYALKVADIKDFRFHDLRHTCGSYLAMNGANAVEMADVLGHKTLAMVRRYAHLSQTHVSTVVSNMTEKVFGHVKL